MLKRLYIKNFAIVDELEVDFESGFQVITGETGAGKSIMVGAIGLLCGERGQSDMVRSGESKAILEAEFFLKNYNVDSFLAENGFEANTDSLFIRREIQPNGVSRGFINDSPANITILNKISDYLIDLHGQHQHQRLLNADSHINYLDDYGKLHREVILVSESFELYNKRKVELDALISEKQLIIEKKDLYAFQIDELGKANLRANEEEELEAERLKLENSEILFNAAHQISTMLYSGEETALKVISNAAAQIKQVSKFDKDFVSILENLETARVSVQEVGRFCEEYSTSLDFDPQRLEEIRTREAQIEWIKKKYQISRVEELIELKKDLEKQVIQFANYDELIKKVQQQLEVCRKDLESATLSLSEKRKTVAITFETQLVNLLKSVGLLNADFQVQITRVEDENGPVAEGGKRFNVQKNGIDRIEFYVGLNIGEPARPLQKVASGGEVSRIMLCIKALLADTDDIETLVFDEIDSGISGRFAQIVGQKLREISTSHQLIVITHLPQIAAQGEVQYTVRKSELSGRTTVEVIKLTFEERIKDIAGLLGGTNVSQSALDSARELLLEAKVHPINTITQ
jgi:DNA repair protein RecN (Recombination protein N)